MSIYVYVLAATDDDGKVKECIVVEDGGIARSLYDTLQQLYGSQRVYLTSRRIDEMPANITRYAMNELATMREERT
jgi:hypothetical protein